MGLPMIISKGDSLCIDRGEILRVIRARGSSHGHSKFHSSDSLASLVSRYCWLFLWCLITENGKSSGDFD